MAGTITDVVIYGNATADAKFLAGATKNGEDMATFTVAVNSKDSQGKDRADFYPIICFRKSAEIARDTIKKGVPLAVKCGLQTATTDNDGQKHTEIRLVAHFILVGAKRQKEEDGSYY